MGVTMIGYTPKTADGRPIVLSSAMADEREVQHTGCGDDVDNGIRLVGTNFMLTSSGIESATVEWQFINPVDVAGGVIRFQNAVLGDYVDYEIYAPATTGTENVGAGWFDKYPIGAGVNMYVPNGTHTGDWDLDLDEPLNENVSFTKVVPIPASAGDGWFDYDIDTDTCTLNGNGEGGYYLFDFDCALSKFINRIWLLGTSKEDLAVPASYGAKRLLPQWKHKVTIYHSTDSATLEAVWRLFLGRANTTVG